MEAIILAGGLGSRLRAVCADRPKPMAEVRGEPFLAHLMRYWAEQGISHFILSVGYLHEKITSHFGSSFEGIPLHYAIEEERLDTGGGLLLGSALLKEPSSPFLLLNGDTLFTLSLSKLRAFHQEKEESHCTLALFPIKENSRYDGVAQSASGQITSLSRRSPLINGGCYLLTKETLAPFPKKCSLEKEILPHFIERRQCYGLPFPSATFIDIGIPQDLKRYCSPAIVSE